MKKRPAFISLLSSYAILFSIILLIAAGICAQILHTMEIETHATYDRFLTQTGHDVDAIIESYRKLALNLAMQSKIEALVVSQQPTAADQRQLMIDVHAILHNAGTNYSSIESAYLYLPRQDAILSSKGYSGIDEYFNNYLDLSFDSQDSWLSLLRNVNYNAIISQNGKLLFVVSLPVGRVSSFSGSLVVEVKADDVLSRLDVIHDVYQGSAAVVEQTSRIILSRGEDEQLVRRVLDTGQDYRLVFNGQNALISRVASAVSDWEYVALVFEDALFNQIRSVRNSMLIAGTVCVLIGVLLAWLFSQSNYKPVKRLLELIGKTGIAGVGPKMNEYNYVERSIQCFIQEKDTMAEQLKEHRRDIRDQYLRRLLHGYLHEPEAIYQTLLSFNLDFARSAQAVFLISGIDRQQMSEAIDCICQVAVDGTLAVGFTLENLVAGVASFDCSRLDHQMPAIFMESLYEKVRLLRGSEICMGYGTPYAQIELVPISYEEASHALEHRQLLDGEGVVGFRDLSERADSSKNISFHDQIKLQNALEANNFQEAEKIFNDIIVRYFPDTGASTQMIKCRMFGLINTMILSISESHIQKDDPFWDEFKPVDRLLKCATVRELVRESQNIFHRFNRALADNRSKLLDQKQLEIKCYITEHFQDPDLSVAMIADHFEMHPTYLSRQYKQVNNIGLLDQIHALRIAEARRLLNLSRLNMREISRRVGYNNELSFYRAFKRVEGLTPSQFKVMREVGHPAKHK